MKQKDYRLAAIVFTDIHGFSRMMERNEAGTLALLQLHNELIGKIVKAHGGSIIKTIGDALLMDFKNTVDALQSAMEIQDQLYQYNKEHTELPLLVRIGVHLGDIYFYENDALGEGINIASRLQSIAHPGCICISQDVYNHVLNKIDFQAQKLGRVSLKNISKEIHAYEITTPNIEFDPEHDKPRPGFKPGTYALGGQDGEVEFIAEADAKASATQALKETTSPAAREAQAAVQKADDPSGAADLKRIMDSIKRSILSDIKAQGRRLTVEEVRAKYGMYGADVETVIADLAGKGILQRGSGGLAAGAAPQDASGARGQAAGTGNQQAGFSQQANFSQQAGYGPQGSGPGSSYSDRFVKIGQQIVEEVAKSIEKGIDRSRGQERWENRAPRRGFVPDLGFGPDAPQAPNAPQAPGRPSAATSELNYDFGDPKVRAMSSKWERKLANSPFSSVKENYVQDFGIYRDTVVAAAKRSKFGFIPNLAAWLGVSAFLAFINFQTHTPPWSIIPFFAWGVGVVEHFFAVFRKGEKAREIENMPDLNPDQLTLFKRIHLSRDAFTFHGISTAMVSLLLLAINGFTYVVQPHGMIPWALIPTAAMGFSFLSHAAVHFPRIKSLEAIFIKSLGLAGSWKSLFRGKQRQAANVPQGPYQDLYAEALSIKSGIIEQLKKGKKKSGPVDKDMIPALEEFVGQIRLLASRAGEVDAIVDTIPMAALETDKAELLRKESEAGNERMKREYRKSIEEIEKQERSFQELENQREMLQLRLKSSVNSLKQMRIDVARISTMDGMDEDSAVLMVKQRTTEITQYLDDLRAGLDEEERDPYKELEEAERKRLEGERAAKAGALAGGDPETRLLEARRAELDRLGKEMGINLAAGGTVPSTPPGVEDPAVDEDDDRP